MKGFRRKIRYFIIQYINLTKNINIYIYIYNK
jgi:hypothetical protein